MTRAPIVVIGSLTFAVSACSDATLSVNSPSDGSAEHLHASPIAVDFDDRPDGATGLPQFAVDISHWSGEITDAEVRCWYDEGVRHVIVGTQRHRISKQQLEQALEGGMSVDAYVYLYWSQDLRERVERDVEVLRDYPIGRLWLDVEENPRGLSSSQLESRIEDALDGCGDVPCGIYTGAWWWEEHMAGSDEFGDVPLWYSWYDVDPAMTTWRTQRFGSWEAPWGKQWQETYFCGIDVDKSSIFVDSEPVSPPKTFSSSGSLTVPTGLYPTDLVQVRRTQNARVLVDTVPGATGYEFEVQHFGGRWLPYHTFSSSIPAARFSASVSNRVFRFRARASNEDETTGWSSWSYFEMGLASHVPPEANDDVDAPAPPSTPASSDEPNTESEEPDAEAGAEPDDQAPTGLTPDDGARLPNGEATLACDAVAGATRYAFEIEFWRESTSSWVPYFTYRTDEPERTFYPRADTAFRWRVIVALSSGEESSSPWRRFLTGDAESP